MGRGKRKNRALRADELALLENLKSSRQLLIDQANSPDGARLPPVEISDNLLRAMARRAPPSDYAPLEFYRRLGVKFLALDQLDSITDDEVHRQLWHALRLASLLGIGIDKTDHLTDRELYGVMIRRVLHEKMRIRHALAHPEESAIDSLLADYSNQTVNYQLRFYRDEHDEDSIADFETHLINEGLDIPLPEPRPANRDQFLM